MKIVDVIERELRLPVSRQRAWDSITRPEELSQWFGDVVELDFDVGGKFIMRWENGDTTTGVVETIEEPHKFAYRWYASEMGNHLPLSPENSTLVTFLLEEVERRHSSDSARDWICRSRRVNP